MIVLCLLALAGQPQMVLGKAIAAPPGAFIVDFSQTTGLEKLGKIMIAQNKCDVLERYQGGR